MSSLIESHSEGKSPQRENVAATLLVFSDDWGRHPSSCQHLIQRLKSRHRVVWVNTIGMRPPTWGWSTLRRGFEKIQHWSPSSRPTPNPPDETRGEVTVLNPKMWPWFRRRHDRAFNGRLLLGQLRPVIEPQPGPVLAITTIPIVADLMGKLPVEKWIYYCVDDFGTWPGLDQKPLAELEAEVIGKADILVAASRVLKERLETTRSDVTLLPHGVELAHWAKSSEHPHPLLEPLEKPVVSFWGLVDRRMDLEFLRALSKTLDRGTIALVGPEENPDPKLAAIPRIRRLPALPYEELPQIAEGSQALLLPYQKVPVTLAMQPLKLLEYLATGKPVIARDLPATRAWADALDLADSPERFAWVVQERLKTRLPSDQKAARRRLATESWDARARDFEERIFA